MPPLQNKTGSEECSQNLGSIILATFSDLNSLDAKGAVGEFYDPESNHILRCVALTRTQNASEINEIYIFDPQSNRPGLTVESDKNIRSIEIDVGPHSRTSLANQPLGLAISDLNLFLFNPSEAHLIKQIPLKTIESARVPVIFHDEENPRAIFIIERDHVQVLSRETGIIFHDIYLSKIFPAILEGSPNALRVFDLKKDIVIDKLEPQDSGVISRVIGTPSGGIIDVTLDNTQLVLRDSRRGDVLKTFLLKDMKYPLDATLYRGSDITFNLVMKPDGMISLYDQKSKTIFLKFRKGAVSLL